MCVVVWGRGHMWLSIYDCASTIYVQYMITAYLSAVLCYHNLYSVCTTETEILPEFIVGCIHTEYRDEY